MHKARAFFFVCAGIFLLALAYHLGARSATAQAPGDSPVVGIASYFGVWVAVTSSGQVFDTTSPGLGPWRRGVNLFGGSTSATQETWGGVKARYRQAAPTAPQDK